MTPRALTFDRREPALDAVRRLIGIRFAEVLESGRSFGRETDAERLHALRLACKRLRFAIERINGPLPDLTVAAQRLAQIVAELGNLHDSALLLERTHDANVDGTLPARIQADRERSLLRARALWVDAFADAGPFAPLIAFTGFGGSAR
ncbi:MAG: CHAD domain-containing protein [Vulcanimicrobiaceae bacterium]